MNPLEMLNNPSMLHAAVVHMPIVLGILGIPMLIACAIFYHNNTLRWVSFVAFALLTATAWYAEVSGEAARSEVPNTLSQEIWELIDEHEGMAFWVKYAAGLTSLFLLLSLFRQPAWRKGTLLLAACGASFTALIITFTAHMGGTLVYEHGVGTPTSGEGAAASQPSLAPQPQPEPAPEAEQDLESGVEEPIEETAPENQEETVTEALEVEEEEALAGEDSAEQIPEAIAPEASTEEANGDADADAEEDGLIPVRALSESEAEEVSYQEHVRPILETHCMECHDPEFQDGGFEVTSIETLKQAGDKAGPGVIPGEPDNSAIIQYVRGEFNPQMPYREDPLTEEEVHTLRLWIFAGAKDN